MNWWYGRGHLTHTLIIICESGPHAQVFKSSLSARSSNMVSSRFYQFVSIIPYIPTILAVQVHAASRIVVSSATCIDGYSWMNNGQGDSPCLTVAYVEAACSENNYDQPILDPGYSYPLPNASTEFQNPCYCSWSSYNLMMACTLCQGTNATLQWPQWASACTTNLSWTEEYFPSGYVLSGNASIPYWATIDPTTWTYETFNILDASAIYQTNSSYITPNASPSSSSSSSSSKSTDVGAIVGGTVGGAVALLLLAIGAYILYRRHTYRKGHRAINRQGTAFIFPGTHRGIASDTSNFIPLITTETRK